MSLCRLETVSTWRARPALHSGLVQPVSHPHTQGVHEARIGDRNGRLGAVVEMLVLPLINRLQVMVSAGEGFGR